MSHLFNWSCFVLLTSLLFACGTSRNVAQEDHNPRKKQEDILAALDSLSAVNIDNFYSKVSTNYKDSSQNVSFKTSLRVVNDSAVSAIITYANIPVVNALISSDSVKITNRRDKCFILRDLAYFREEFGIDFNLENIEELLLGKPVAYVRGAEYFRVNNDPENAVCSHKKKDIRKNEREGLREIVTYYTLDDSLSNLTKMEIISPEDSTTIEVRYLERELLEGYMVPAHIIVTIFAPRQTIEVDLEYRKSHVNRPEEIHFVIPENYENCQ